MQRWNGHLRKMAVRHDTPVGYTLRGAAAGDDEPLELNPLIGSEITLRASGEIRCVHCGRKTSKSFGDGSCFPCFRRLPQNDICIVKPELCHYHKEDDPCRDPAWGEEHCMIDHVLYAAVSSGFKIGITRHTQIPTRWIDQGASYAQELVRLPDRLAVGRLEKALSASFSDRTGWQKMLKNQAPEIDLDAAIDAVLGQMPHDQRGAVIEERRSWRFSYPVLVWPLRVRSVQLAKTAELSGRLTGIRGQYLMIGEDVLNVRRHSGYEVELSFIPAAA